MTYRLFVTDVDGTLLTASGEIDPRDAAAIERLVARGIPVTICTGRMYSGTRHLAEKLGLDAPLACVDGSHIVHAPSGRQLHATPLAREAAKALLEVIQEFGPSAFAFGGDHVFHEPGGTPYLDYVRIWSEQMNEVGDLLFDVDWAGETIHVTAVLALGSEQQVKRAEQALVTRGAGLLQTVTFPAFRAPRSAGTHSWGMIARAAGVDKGTAIDWLCRHYGVAPEEIVAVGDWLNDIPMFRRVGRGFAMGQAPDEVKAAASDVLETDAFRGGGLAEAAKRSGLL